MVTLSTLDKLAELSSELPEHALQMLDAVREETRATAAAARAMLAALRQDVLQFDTLHRLGTLTEQQCADCTQFARAAIAQAEAAGIKAGD